MIYVKNNGLNTYEPDIRALINSFYPGEEIVYVSDTENALNDPADKDVFKAVYLDIDRICRGMEREEDRFRDKNNVKRAVYNELSGLSERQLPWGTLTGIRPVRILERYAPLCNSRAELEEKCQEIKNGTISDELYAKFSNIVRKKNGLGVVPVHGQVCMGCDMVLPVQFVIDLRQKQEHNEIDYCPYCSRIIWYEPLDPETEKNYIFEQLESRGTESKSSHKESAQESDSYDESMGMDGGFEDF